MNNTQLSIQSIKSLNSGTGRLDRCQRCKTRDAMFYCHQCESFQNYCRFCDTYVHGLPSKKGHNRTPIVKNDKPITLETNNRSFVNNNTTIGNEGNNTNKNIASVNKFKNEYEAVKLKRHNSQSHFQSKNNILTEHKTPNFKHSKDTVLNNIKNFKQNKQTESLNRNRESFNEPDHNKIYYQGNNYPETLTQENTLGRPKPITSTTSSHSFGKGILSNTLLNRNRIDDYNNISKSRIFNKLNNNSKNILYEKGVSDNLPINTNNNINTNESNTIYDGQENYLDNRDSQEQADLNSAIQRSLENPLYYTNDYSSNQIQSNRIMDYYMKNNTQFGMNTSTSGSLVNYNKNTLSKDFSSDSFKNKGFNATKTNNSNYTKNMQSNNDDCAVESTQIGYYNAHKKTDFQDDFGNDRNNPNATNMSINTEVTNNTNVNKSCLPHVQSSYSRDYVNELRNVFLREKNELIFKNNSLQNTIDKLKNSFSEQISQMTNQIEDTNRKHHFSLKSLEENIDSYYKTIILEKETTIEDQQAKINSLLDSNKNLSERLNKIEISLEDLNSKKTSIEDYYSKLLADKDVVLKQLSEEIKIKETQIQAELDNQGKNMSQNYQNTINQIAHESEEMKQSLGEELNRRDNEIHRLGLVLSETGEKFTKQIRDLEEEVACHKQNIICYRDRRVELEAELKNLKDVAENLKREIKLKSNEVKILESNNFGLMKENDELRVQLNKLDKLVYGKVKSQPKFKN